MDSRLKQRLIGAAVLVALAVIFLPMLVQGPAPDSGVSNVPLSMPAPPRSDYETRDLPLVTPGDAPAGGAVGMGSDKPSAPAPSSVPIAATAASPVNSATPPAGDAVGNAATPTPASVPDVPAPLPATTAGGDYAVSFGTYATPAAVDAVLATLRAARLPAYREATTSGGKPAWRVRIGPYASRADAETARLHSSQVRADVDARVVVLDASVAPSPAAPRAGALPGSKPAAPKADATTPAAASAPTSSPTPSKAVAQPTATGTGFAIQLAAYSKPDDAKALRDKVRAAGFTAFTETVATDKGTLTRVRVGPVATQAEAEQLKAQLKTKLGLDGIVRPHP